MLLNKNQFGLIALAVLLIVNPLTVPMALSVDYTEDLLEVTDEGVLDANGNFLDPLDTLEEDALLTPSLTPPLQSFDSFEEYQQTIINNLGGKKVYTEKRLQGIKESLEQELQDFERLGKTVEEAEEKLAPLQQEVKNLTDQINVFNEQLRFTREKISDVETQIAERQLDMKIVMEEVKKSEIHLKVQEEAVLNYVSLLYAEEAQFMDLYSDGASTLKLLLADSTVSENLLGKEYTAVMEQTGRKVFHDLEASYRDLKQRQSALLLSQTKLNRLYASLAAEKEILEETRQSKKELLEYTKGEEEKYQMLLEESIRQQLDSALAIQNMKDSIEMIESKLQLLEDKIEEEAKREPSDALPEGPVPDALLYDPDTLTSETFFQWPVAPRAITAYFKDSNYPSKWGVHQAIDIRAPQFTPIQAPANGYVVEAKDNGMGYSYIILAHKKNLVTVYGHVYEILVKPGMLVEQGDVIGYSGGTPGTHGAGLQTTGPHLHFEVHFKGSPVDPLDYLPVLELPMEYVPERFLGL